MRNLRLHDSLQRQVERQSAEHQIGILGRFRATIRGDRGKLCMFSWVRVGVAAIPVPGRRADAVCGVQAGASAAVDPNVIPPPCCRFQVGCGAMAPEVDKLLRAVCAVRCASRRRRKVAVTMAARCDERRWRVHVGSMRGFGA